MSQAVVDGVTRALGAVFFVAWHVGVAGWLYAIAEMLAVTGFVRLAFATGLKAVEFEETVLVRPTPLVPAAVLATEHAKLKAVDEGQYLFREKFRLFDLRIHTPFPLKGTIRLHGSTAHIVGRLPVGPSVFFAAWAAGWTAGGLAVLLQGGLAGLPLLLFGLGFVYAISIFALRLEKPRFQRAYEEVKAELGWITAASSSD